ncbi:MAG: glycosyltransferase family 2 protein [Oscillospiraceae bacterium]|nr:glycosyltransferase family 2 protein [Oscillospiraceae bacterium]
MKNILYIVIPCYNEQEVLSKTAKLLKEKIYALINNNKIASNSKICFVNDGSKDKTWDIIYKLNQSDDVFTGIDLSKNRGHQNALLAGLLTVKDRSDMVISMDADLQDDINAIDKMVDKYLDGCDIVYGVRNNRDSDNFFKRFTAETFYRFMNILGAKTIFNHADFRLMSKRAIEGLEQFKEVNLFLRGIIPMIGFRTDYVYYSRNKREAGESKYPLTKMISFAFEGITSLSNKLIRIISLVGILALFVSVIMLIYTFVNIISGKSILGWGSIMISLWAIGGLVLLSIGVVGEYIGKIYIESKHRPRYIIKQDLDDIEK